MVEVAAPVHRRPQWWRKIWALVAGSTMAMVMGAIAATLIGFGASWIVITLSHMLKK
jgi:ABC-type phosphate/phosphonate transport system permease subunit